jgi:DNA helicase-2/ATP-dependent DNA helicase PcrA
MAERVSRYKCGLHAPASDAELLLFQRYGETLRSSNAMDFDDLLLNTLRLFEEEPGVKARYARSFRYIHVDEYQDTNRHQYLILRALSEEWNNLFVVGDDDQSVYAFRGADIRNILEFESDFPDTTVIRLEQNYRSTKTILKAASAVIACNECRKGKTLWTENTTGAKIRAQGTPTEADEARHVSQLILESGRRPSEFLVLYRANSQSRPLEEWLRRSGVPYVIVGGIRFYERKEVKDVVAYLKVLANPRDGVSFQRAVSTPPRGIGPKTLERLETYATERGLTPLEASAAAAEIESLGAAASGRLLEVHRTFDRLQEAMRETSVPDLIMRVIDEADYFTYLESKHDRFEADRKRENLRELVESAEEFVGETGGGLLDYLNFVSLRTDVDDWENPEGYVTLMTVHNAKGVEFPVVIITGLEEGTFPHHLTLESEAEVEEERRLFHVALTRAKQEVHLTTAGFRAIRGRAPIFPSRFLDEIPGDCMERAGAGAASQEGFASGDIVYHGLFGRGEIVSSGDGKVKVRFACGLKTLVPRYARLKKA